MISFLRIKKLLVPGMWAGFMLFFACEDPVNPENGDTGGPPDTVHTNVPGDYLILTDPVEIKADYPDAPDGNLTINVRDTLFLIEGHSYRGRVSVLHDPLMDINGFYVWVSGMTTAYYYDVPEVPEEGSDSTAVIYIGMDPPDELEFPYSVTVIIQPHDADGVPVDEFSVPVTSERPLACDIFTEGDAWKWMFTEMYDYQGNLFQVTAPSATAIYHDNTGGYEFSGCCVSDVYVPYNESTGVDGICDERNPHFKDFHVNTTYTYTVYDFLFIFSSGNFIHYNGSVQTNFNPEKSVCAGRAVYDAVATDYTKTGTHDYVSGDADITMTTTAAIPPFGPNPPRGAIVNTCHLMAITWGLEERYNFYYERFPESNSGVAPEAPDYYE